MKYLILFISALSPMLALAQGGSGSHGGDITAFEFFQTGNSLLQQIERLSPDELLSISDKFEVDLLKQAINETRITSTTNELIYLNAPVDAINHTDESPFRIEVQRDKRWNLALPQKRELIVLHEYLGIVEKLKAGAGEWDHYRLSNRILGVLRSKNMIDLNRAEAWNERFIAAWRSASPLNFNQSQNYYCSEHSALNPILTPLTNRDPVLMSIEKDEFYLHLQTQIRIKSERRADNKLNVLFILSDEETGKPLAYRVCRKDVSAALERIDLIQESMLHMIEIFSGPGFESYTHQVHNILGGRKYKKCVENKNIDACNEIGLKVARLPYKEEGLAAQSLARKLNDFKLWIRQNNPNETILKFYDDIRYAFLAVKNKMRIHLDLGNSKDLPQLLPEYYEQFTEMGQMLQPSINKMKLNYDRYKSELIGSSDP